MTTQSISNTINYKRLKTQLVLLLGKPIKQN